MSDLAELAEQYQRNAIAWDAAGPPRVAASIEVCQRHAADWDALHTLAMAGSWWVERLDPTYPDIVLRAEEDIVAACRRLAAHLKEPTSPTPETPRTPCPEGFHWIGQAATTCDRCGLPAWDHAGMAKLGRPLASPSDKPEWVLDPWKPGEREAIRRRWDPSYKDEREEQP